MGFVKQAEYKSRRQKLMSQMGENSIAVIFAGKEYIRNQDSTYPYRPNSNFYYLSGFEEPEAVLVLIPGRKEGEYVFFNQANNIDLETWIGKRIGQEGVCENYGVDEAFPIEQLNDKMPELLTGKEALYFSFGFCHEQDKQVGDWLNQIRQRVRSGVPVPEKLVNVNALIHEMRVIKSDAEIDLMRHISKLSAKAHVEGMKACKTAKYEYQIESTMWHYLSMHGARFWAYSPIVAAGSNACVLHYVNNTAALNANDLLLVDAGGEYEYYASDITRTYPIGGKFSEEQRLLYELVLKSQKAGIDAVKPGAAWDAPEKAIVPVLTEGLLALGILKGSLNDLIKNNACKEFYMHRSGHFLGLDVHDAGSYTTHEKWRCLEQGMVLTIEPGLYIKANTNHVDSRWWNIGIRIEDDILVTKSGSEVLTAEVPKEIHEIEHLMNK